MMTCEESIIKLTNILGNVTNTIKLLAPIDESICYTNVEDILTISKLYNDIKKRFSESEYVMLELLYYLLQFVPIITDEESNLLLIILFIEKKLNIITHYNKICSDIVEKSKISLEKISMNLSNKYMADIFNMTLYSDITNINNNLRVMQYILQNITNKHNEIITIFKSHVEPKRDHIRMSMYM